MRSLWDITPTVSTASAVFPGDTPLSVRWNARTGEGAAANVSTICLTPHLGAHVDAPLHLKEEAPDVSALNLEVFVGPCRVIDLSDGGKTGPIQPEELSGKIIGERVLIKTRRTVSHEWTPDFRSLSPEAVRLLMERGVCLIGLDVPSIDEAISESLPSHRLALMNGISVIENLDLQAVPAGLYELIALPLRLEGVEASPVRAVLRTLNR